MCAGDAEPQPPQRAVARVHEGLSEQAGLGVLLAVIAISIRVRVGIGAGAVRDTDELTDRVPECPAEEVPADLDTDVTIWHQGRRQAELHEAVVLIGLQTLESHRPLELASLHGEPRRDACGHERFENGRLAATELRRETEVVIVVDGSFDDRTDFAEQESIGRLRRDPVHEPASVECKIAAEADDIRAILTGEGEAGRPRFDTAGRYEPWRVVCRSRSLRHRCRRTLDRGRRRAGQGTGCLRHRRRARRLASLLRLCHGRRASTRSCRGISSGLVIRGCCGISSGLAIRHRRGIAARAIPRGRLLALQHFELVFERLDAPVLLLDLLEQRRRIRRRVGLRCRAAEGQRKNRECSEPRTGRHESSFDVLVVHALKVHEHCSYRRVTASVGVR